MRTKTHARPTPTSDLPVSSNQWVYDLGPQSAHSLVSAEELKKDYASKIQSTTNISPTESQSPTFSTFGPITHHEYRSCAVSKFRERRLKRKQSQNIACRHQNDGRRHLTSQNYCKPIMSANLNKTPEDSTIAEPSTIHRLASPFYAITTDPMTHRVVHGPLTHADYRLHAVYNFRRRRLDRKRSNVAPAMSSCNDGTPQQSLAADRQLNQCSRKRQQHLHGEKSNKKRCLPKDRDYLNRNKIPEHPNIADSSTIVNPTSPIYAITSDSMIHRVVHGPLTHAEYRSRAVYKFRCCRLKRKHSNVPASMSSSNAKTPHQSSSNAKTPEPTNSEIRGGLVS